jgi:hypothetical protein
MHIIFHVGPGKTGTTSIQNFLFSRKEGRNYFFAGLFFNTLELDKPYKGDFNFLALSEKELFDVFSFELDFHIAYCKDRNIDCLILSNEAFFLRLDVFLDVFRSRFIKNHELTILMYVRPVKEWIRSAYDQWGIKHKMSTGPIRSACDFASTTLPPYLNILEKIAAFDMENHLVVRNISNLPNKDVLKDFCSIFNLSHENAPKENMAPTDLEIMVYYAVNSQFETVVTPSIGQRLIERIKEVSVEPNLVEKITMTDEMFDQEKINIFIRECNKLLPADHQLIKENEVLLRRVHSMTEIEIKLVHALAQMLIDNDHLVSTLQKLEVDNDHLASTLQKIEADFHEVKSSDSWKVTRPLRYLGSRFTPERKLLLRKLFSFSRVSSKG